MDYSFADAEAQDFKGADLRDARFLCANLRGSDFSGAHHFNIGKFSGANLAYCRFDRELAAPEIASANRFSHIGA